MASDNLYFVNTVTQSLSQASTASSTSHVSFGSNASGTTSVSHMDELVKEYLLYRGFNATLKAFEQELKQDRDRSLRADKITDQLMAYIHGYDLNAFMDYWSYLEGKYFANVTLKLSAHHTHSHGSLTKRYETNLMKYYMVNAIRCGRVDKAYELIENYMVKFQSQFDWREWFALPFVKNPHEHPYFAVYFSQNWIDGLLVSLQNFLNILFQSMQLPRLLNYNQSSCYWNNKKTPQFVYKTTQVASSESTDSDYYREYFSSETNDEFEPLSCEHSNVHNQPKFKINHSSSIGSSEPSLVQTKNKQRQQLSYPNAIKHLIQNSKSQFDKNSSKNSLKY